MQSHPDRRALGRALLPLRLFLGITFLYAGLDKFLDPAFLQAAGAGSIADQLHLYELISPLAPIVQALGEPFAVQIGFLIAVGEIGIGLGILTGMAFRLCALGGLALSVLFFLTVSFTTLPYYYGPDLPYGMGFLTLLIAGPLDVWVFDPRRLLMAAAVSPATGDAATMRLPRRDILSVAILGVVSVALGIAASVSPFRRAPIDAGLDGSPDGSAAPSLGPAGSDSALASADAGATPGATDGTASAAPGDTPAASTATDPGATPAPGSTPAPGATPGPTPAPGATATPAPTPAPTPKPTPTPAPAGTLIGTVSTVQANGSSTFKVPSNGDPGVLVALTNGSIGCWDAKCTHAGCTCAYQTGTKLLSCPCHGALFDPNNGAAVVKGPATKPLAALKIQISADGKIYLV